MIRINLTPGPTSRGVGFSGVGMNLGVIFLAAYVLALVAVGGYWWTLAAAESRLLAETQRAEQELASLKATISQGSNVREQLGDMQKRVQVIEDLTKGQTRSIVLVDSFADMVPNDLWITAIEDKGATLKVTGTAFSTTAVSNFMTNLRASGKFKEVDIIVSRQDLAKSPRLVTFEVTCRFEG